MNGVADTTSPASKRSTSPRPPTVGKEVKEFHDTSQRFPEPYKNWNMECQSKASFQESADISSADQPTQTTSCTENKTELAEGVEDSTNPSPPAPVKWAQSLKCLLEDSQGVTLFTKFLREENHDMRCLNFWLACMGVKKKCNSDRKVLVKLIKVIFEKQVKRISAISNETKEEIRQKLSSKTDVNDTIFDKAQQEVETYMIKTTYPNFLKSDLYIQYLGGWTNEYSPEKERVVSPEPLNRLQTLDEDSELNVVSNIIPLSKTGALSKNRISLVSKFKPEGPAGFLRSPYSNYSSYHTKYSSYLPASAQDSELQSLSSDAQTDDTMSLTDGSSANFPMSSRSKQKHHRKAPKHIAALNEDGALKHPRTELGPQEQMRPFNCKEFHGELVMKLNKYLKDVETREKLTEKLKSVENNDWPKAEAISFPCPRSNFKPCPNPVFEPGLLCGPSEEIPQDILDRHISMVFDSGQHTPASGCTSPPVARPYNDVLDKSRLPLRGSGSCEASCLPSTATHKHNQLPQFTMPSSIEYRRDRDIHPRDMIDYISDDNVPSSSRSQYSPIVGNSEPVDYSRRSKEHSKRYASKKNSSMTDSRSSFVDSGISLTCESIHSYSKVTRWLEKGTPEQEQERDMWRYNTSTSPNRFTSSNRKAVPYNTCRSRNQDVGCSQWSAAPSQLPQACMAGYEPVDTTSNLIDVRRKLEDENRAKMKLRSTSGGRNMYDASRMKFSKGYDSFEDGLCHRKPNRKSCSISMLEAATANTPCNDVTVVGYSYGRHSVPYLSKLPGKNITLRQFKSLLSKKGNFRYFFKTASDDFGTGVVFEEVTEDSKVLPLWEGKVFCVIDALDDNTI